MSTLDLNHKLNTQNLTLYQQKVTYNYNIINNINY